jgi:hypothetical protein
MLVIHQPYCIAGRRNSTEGPAYIPDHPLVTVKVSVKARVSQGRKVMLEIAEGPPCPCVTRSSGGAWLLEEIEETFPVRIQETVFNTIAAKHAREPRNTGRRFAWLCNRRIDEDYQSALRKIRATG